MLRSTELVCIILELAQVRLPPVIAILPALTLPVVDIVFDPNQIKLADPSKGELLFSSMKSFLLKRGGKI
jgi:hypothetical protein